MNIENSKAERSFTVGEETIKEVKITVEKVTEEGTEKHIYTIPKSEQPPTHGKASSKKIDSLFGKMPVSKRTSIIIIFLLVLLSLRLLLGIEVYENISYFINLITQAPSSLSNTVAEPLAEFFIDLLAAILLGLFTSTQLNITNNINVDNSKNQSFITNNNIHEGGSTEQRKSEDQPEQSDTSEQCDTSEQYAQKNTGSYSSFRFKSKYFGI